MVLEAKSADALRTIGEVANDIGVATHVLRFWESKFPQIKPQKRRGRRYYANTDIETIKTIQELLYTHGYTIKGVRKFLKEKKTLKDTPFSSIPANSEDLSGSEETNLLEAPREDNFKRDLFGNIIAENDDTAKTLPTFGEAEFAKLKQIYKGLCASRNKLNDAA